MRRAFLLPAMTIIAVSAAVAAHAQDRYGPAPAYESDPPQRLATLTWPGKTSAQPAPHADARDTRTQAPPTGPPVLPDAPPTRWRAADPTPARPVEPQAATIYAPGDGLPPHFYSVARQYGVQPDPVQLSPQFLAATPQSDLADPPPLPPPHAAGPQSANISATAATNQVRQAQQAAADADSAALGN